MSDAIQTATRALWNLVGLLNRLDEVDFMEGFLANPTMAAPHFLEVEYSLWKACQEMMAGNLELAVGYLGNYYRYLNGRINYVYGTPFDWEVSHERMAAFNGRLTAIETALA